MESLPSLTAEGMQTFTYDPRRWCVMRVMSRNPLMRWTDRIEAVVVMLAIMVSLLVVPVCGAIGTAIYDAHSHLYAQQARTWHRTTATITGNGNDPVDSNTHSARVQATWAAGGGWRTGSLRWKDPVHAGELIQIWVDPDGNPVGAPAPTSRAGFEAVTIALSIATLMIATSTSLVVVTRWQLNRIRYSQVEREIRTLV